MRSKLLTPKGTNDLLYGEGKVTDIRASYGHYVVDETYNRFIYFDISSSNGKVMYNKAERVYNNPGTYTLGGNNCTVVASHILKDGGIQYSTDIKPNYAFVQSIHKYGYNSNWQLVDSHVWITNIDPYK
jgi:hypothetical protein